LKKMVMLRRLDWPGGKEELDVWAVDAQFGAGDAYRHGCVAAQRLGAVPDRILIAHIFVIGTAVRGEEDFDELLENFDMTPFLVLDAGLVGVVAFHASTAFASSCSTSA
jgi:hypothetical protein